MNIRLTHLVSAGLLFTGVLVSTTAAAQLPDLTITDLKVNQQCQVEVTIKNLGPGSLPETAFYVGTQPALQLYRDNAPAGAVKLNQRSLQAAGGTYTHTFVANNQVVSGSFTYRAKIDKNNIVVEANENNNEMTNGLSCVPVLPDLAITKISFNKSCLATVTLKNVGTLPYPATSFNLINVSRRIDGASKGYRKLTHIDPSGVLKTPGGEVQWTDLPDFIATSSARYQFSGSGLSAEGNTANNQLTRNIPTDGCGATTRSMGSKQHKIPKRVSPKLQRKVPLKMKK